MPVAPIAGADPAANGPLALVAAGAGFALAAIWILFGPMLIGATPLGRIREPAMNEAVFTTSIFGAMLAAAVIGGAITAVRPLALGRQPSAMLLLGTALGTSGVSAATLLAWIAGGVTQAPASPPGGAITLGLAVIAVQVAAEEAFFRGWLQPLLARALGLRAAVPLVAIGFGLLHAAAGAHDPLALVNMILGGLAFGLLAARAGGIAPSVAMHFAWNAAEQLVVGLDPNPGVGSFGSLIDLDLVGAALWGGSSEGLNASIGAMVSLLAILTPLLIYARRPA